MTTLEDRIADLQQQAGLLLDLPQQIADTATQRINALGDYWQQRQAQMYTRCYVHQTVGDDAAGGTEDAPLKNIEEALQRTPAGGVCEVRLMGDYHFAAPVPVEQRYLRITSADTVRHAVTLERLSSGSATDPTRYTGGVRLEQNAACEYRGLTLVVPPLDGTWGSRAPIESYCGHVQLGHSGDALAGRVRVAYCDIDIPTNPFCALVGAAGHLLLLETYNLVVSGNLLGVLVPDATDPAGTPVTSLPWLVSNLSTV